MEKQSRSKLVVLAVLLVLLLAGCFAGLGNELEGDCTIIVSINGEGRVFLDPDQTQFGVGNRVTLTVEPVDGWQFDSWSGDITGSDNPKILVIKRSLNITANFVQIDQ